jgi:hypothetical protein
MGRINYGRVVLGGLLAGLIVNAGEFLFHAMFGAEIERRMAAMGINFGPNAIAAFIVIGFIVATIGVWLYAAVRPRLGPGVRTAVMVAVAVWAIGPAVGNAAMKAMDLLTMQQALVGAVWGLVEYGAGIVAGAWLYREEGGTRTM